MPAGNHAIVAIRERRWREQAGLQGESRVANRHFKGGFLMKKVAIVVSSIALLFASGCATKEYVKTQVDPLSDRLARVEARLTAVEAKLNQVAAKEGELSKADRAAINEAKATANKALEVANKAEADAMRAGSDASKAEAAARDAEKAAAKTEKMFKLEQKK